MYDIYKCVQHFVIVKYTLYLKNASHSNKISFNLCIHIAPQSPNTASPENNMKLRC